MKNLKPATVLLLLLLAMPASLSFAADTQLVSFLPAPFGNFSSVQAGQFVYTLKDPSQFATDCAAGSADNYVIFATDGRSYYCDGASNTVKIPPGLFVEDDSNNVTLADSNDLIGIGTSPVSAFKLSVNPSLIVSGSFGGTAVSFSGGSPAAVIATHKSFFGFQTATGDQMEDAQMGNYAGIFGGAENEASGTYATTLGGDNNTLSGDYTVAINSSGVTASGDNITVIGDANGGDYTGDNIISIGTAPSGAPDDIATDDVIVLKAGAVGVNVDPAATLDVAGWVGMEFGNDQVYAVGAGGSKPYKMIVGFVNNLGVLSQVSDASVTFTRLGAGQYTLQWVGDQCHSVPHFTITPINSPAAPFWTRIASVSTTAVSFETWNAWVRSDPNGGLTFSLLCEEHGTDGYGAIGGGPLGGP